MAKDKWTKINDSSNSGQQSDIWKPEKEGDEIAGVYTDKRENVGPNQSVVYTIKKEDGSSVSVWGSTVLDGHLSKVAIGSEVKIVYTGKIPNKQGNRTFKTFDIFVAAADADKKPTEAPSEEVKPDDIPF